MPNSLGPWLELIFLNFVPFLSSTTTLLRLPPKSYEAGPRTNTLASRLEFRLVG